MRWSRVALMLLTSILLLLILAPAALPAEPTVTPLTIEADGGAVLMDATTGEVIFDQDAHKRWEPASVTKLMTLGLALEAVAEGRASLEDQVVTSENAASYGGSQVYLEVGEQRSLEEMLIAIALGSANDGCVAVAEHLAGSEEAFVAEMNKKAAELGLQDTHFVNSHGLPAANHYTTAYDLAQTARWAMQYPKLLQLTSMRYYRFREEPLLELWNLNKLLWWFQGADGLKTGSHSAAHYCLASTAERDGLRLVSVVLGVAKPRGHFAESIKLLNYGFSRFTFKEFYQDGQQVGLVPVGKGAAQEVAAVAEQRVGAAVMRGREEQVSVTVNLAPGLTAPVTKGTKVGEVLLSRNGRQVGRFDAVAARDVPRASLWQQLGRTVGRVLVPEPGARPNAKKEPMSSATGGGDSGL